MARILWLVTSGSMLLAPAIAHCQGYPSKPIRIVVPFAPGGNIDINARIIAPGLSEILKQPVIVENRAGAGGRIGATLVAKSAPDGYTVLLGAPGTLVSQPVFHDDVEYQPLRDFVYTSRISLVSSALSVHPSMPVRSVKELIAFSRARPGEILMGSAGQGSGGHLMGELFQSMAKVKFTHVPYKGGGPAMVDLLAGQVHAVFATAVTSIPHIRSGKLRALGVTTLHRAGMVPDIPTIAEQGLKDFDANNWYGLLAPAKTPRAIVHKLNAEVVKILGMPDVRQFLFSQGLDPAPTTPAEFGAYIKAEMAKWAQVVRAAGASAN